MSPQRQWWLRTLAVLVRPVPVFAALRDDAPEDLEARQEPLLAVLWLAGIASVLPTAAAAEVADEVDGLSLAVWAFLAGGVYGGATYFLLGAALLAGARAMGSLATYRVTRHVLGFALVPVAVSLALWLAKFALYGERAVEGGSAAFALLQAGFAAWALALLLVGVRALHAWTWTRALGALAVVLLVVGAFALLPFAV